MTATKFTVTKMGAHTVIALQDSITYLNCAELLTQLQEVIGSNQSVVILDFKATGFLDSMALEMLLRLQDAVTERGGQLKIAGLNAVCRDILLSTRLINQFHIYADVQGALGETL